MATRKTTTRTVKKSSKAPVKAAALKTTKTKKPESQMTSTRPTVSTPGILRSRIKVKRRTAIIALVIIALVGLVVYYRSLFVVATVNGQPISRLSYIQETEAVYVPDARVTAGKQAMNQIITKTLLSQEANRRHITVSDKEINDSVNKTRESLKKSGQTLESALALQGDSLPAYKARIRIQMILDKLVGTITVSDKEIAGYIEKNKASLPADASEADLKTQAKESLRQQKYSEKVQALISGLQQKAKITYLIPQ
ncbi:MAG: SurA N-terminal domain-containing protein [Patescibacteria group bacterium]